MWTQSYKRRLPVNERRPAIWPLRLRLKTSFWRRIWAHSSAFELALCPFELAVIMPIERANFDSCRKILFVAYKRDEYDSEASFLVLDETKLGTRRDNWPSLRYWKVWNKTKLGIQKAAKTWQRAKKLTIYSVTIYYNLNCKVRIKETKQELTRGGGPGKLNGRRNRAASSVEYSGFVCRT